MDLPIEILDEETGTLVKVSLLDSDLNGEWYPEEGILFTTVHRAGLVKVSPDRKRERSTRKTVLKNFTRFDDHVDNKKRVFLTVLAGSCYIGEVNISSQSNEVDILVKLSRDTYSKLIDIEGFLRGHITGNEIKLYDPMLDEWI